MARLDFSNEEILLQSIKTGDSDALDYLFQTYYPRLQNYALRFIPEKDIVKDIIQECFIRLWEKHETVRTISIKSLLFVMVRNSCINYLKHTDVVNRRQIKYIAHIQGEEKLYHTDFLYDAECPLLYEELQREIQYAIDQMPQRRKEVFLMSRFEGLKNREIAEKLQISTTAVEKHIAKALDGFERHFKKAYPVDVHIMILAWLIANNI